MISDVMSEAIEEVERYRRELPGTYDDPVASEAIDRALIAMRSLLKLLDSPPPTDAELAAERIEAVKGSPERN